MFHINPLPIEEYTMLRIKYNLFLVSGLICAFAFLGAQTVWAGHAYAMMDNRSNPDAKRILTGIEIDMTAKQVEYILGKPDNPQFFSYRRMQYGKLQIILSKKKRVEEIRYNGICGFVLVKNRNFNILQNPEGIRLFVVEALSRNDLLCPGHDFKRRITECIADVMDYVYG
jgi:hypothetical protein